ncbi:translation factor [Thermococcus aggregans]|uniref:Translation factor n=1 Tax=Thermococcus aggregans TaxID=110163 RepID=A0A9E7MZ46_THEAG|nr:tRNA-binding protein Pbp11 [Thermococcus aggregans]USS41540.1 translation factor [Thermococcus aggregans]
MGLFDTFKKREKEKVEIFSRKSVGKFKVEKTFEVFGRKVLVGDVIEGVIYPGYKVKGEDAALIREIQKEGQRIDFALQWDHVELVLEDNIDVKVGEVVKVYQC